MTRAELLRSDLSPTTRAALVGRAGTETGRQARPAASTRKDARKGPKASEPKRTAEFTTAREHPTALVLDLPEPPSFNAMIELAKQRTRRSRTGGWMKRTLPVVYDQHLEQYEADCRAALTAAGIRPPWRAWQMWRVCSASFRLHNLRDAIELQASLKWPVDALVRLGYVADDSPRHLLMPPPPTQMIDRANRGVTLHIAEGWPITPPPR